MLKTLTRYVGADEARKAAIIILSTLAAMVMPVAIWAVRIYLANHPQP